MRTWGAALGLGAVPVVLAAAGMVAVVRGDGEGDRGSSEPEPSLAPTEGIPWTLTTGSLATEEPGRVVFVTPGPPPGDPRALTAQECIDARPRMEAQVLLRTPHVAQFGPAEQARFEAAIAESRAWFDAGCPPHETLGYYPSPYGSGLRAILIDF